MVSMKITLYPFNFNWIVGQHALVFRTHNLHASKHINLVRTPVGSLYSMRYTNILSFFIRINYIVICANLIMSQKQCVRVRDHQSWCAIQLCTVYDSNAFILGQFLLWGTRSQQGTVSMMHWIYVCVCARETARRKEKERARERETERERELLSRDNLFYHLQFRRA